MYSNVHTGRTISGDGNKYIWAHGLRPCAEPWVGRPALVPRYKNGQRKRTQLKKVTPELLENSWEEEEELGGLLEQACLEDVNPRGRRRVQRDGRRRKRGTQEREERSGADGGVRATIE